MSQLPQTVRPGLRHGPRPERQVERPTGRFEAELGRWLNQARERVPTIKRFAPHLTAIQARIAEIATQDQDTSDAQIKTLRQEARSRGLSTTLVADAFAHLFHRTRQTLGFELHDEQLYAAWCMTHGVMAEMATGEGKTVTAALTATVVALTGAPVHIITANDYLVERDARSLRPLYREFGLRVGFVRSDMDDDERRDAYAADIVYCSNKQLIFDYLRDGKRVGKARAGLSAQLASLFGTVETLPLLRGLCFGIVDEADSVLIDDARTPMIISQATPASREDITEATVALGIARSLETHHYEVDAKRRSVQLTENGTKRVRELTNKLADPWHRTRYADERVRQALTVLHALRQDRDYIVVDDRVLLVDESTGRVLEDRKMQNGLHRMLEIHSGCPPSEDTRALAALSFQRFFPRFLQLCGMSGTLWEVKQEIARTYGSRCVRIPRHARSESTVEPIQVFPDQAAQVATIVGAVRQRQERQQPVLIGTRTVQFSEQLSQALEQANIAHRLLNARQDADEAAVVAQAGQPGAVTVATNMAGRGTDIPLHETAAAAGGLHVIAVEVNDSARVDRQLFGRSARQGDPGSSASILSLEDELIVNFLGHRLVTFARRMVLRGTPGHTLLARWIVRLSQKKCERHQRALRDAAFEAAQHLDRRLALTGELE